MTGESFRAVLRLDDKTFTPVAHNLTAEKAEAKVNELKSQGAEAQILHQASRHKGRSIKTCELCKTAAQNLSQGAGSHAPAEEQNGN